MTAMVSCALLLLGVIQACRGEQMSREAAMSLLRGRVLDGLGLVEPPVATEQGPNMDMAQHDRARHLHLRAPKMSSTTRVNHQTSPTPETSQIIVFPSSDSSCARSDSAPEETTRSHFTYYFQPSMNNQGTLVLSAHFWFYAGEGVPANASAPLFILTSARQLLQAADAPSKMSSDGWSTYQLDQRQLASVAQGPFFLQVRCPACQCHANQPETMPFLDLQTQPSGPVRSPRHAQVNIPWSPFAINLLQRPSQERLEHSSCHREEIEISFEELGWDNWIVHPKVLTFSYCHGNCSTPDRTTALLGITQCCAPVPGSMRSLRITTTSDGGYSFKYEILPNIIPEECTCI